jgi:hypothetical protein
MRDETDKATRHMIALIPNTDNMIAVSLFGDELLTAAVRINMTASQRENGIARSNRMMVTTLPKGGDVRWVDPLEYTLRLPSAASPAGRPPTGRA